MNSAPSEISIYGLPQRKKWTVGVEAGAHTPGWLQRFSAGVVAMAEVIALYRMAGDIDWLLSVSAANMTGFDAFYKRLIDVRR